MVLGGIDKSEFPAIRFGDDIPSETEMENPYIHYKTDEKTEKLHRDKSYILPRNFDDNYQISSLRNTKKNCCQYDGGFQQKHSPRYIYVRSRRNRVFRIL